MKVLRFKIFETDSDGFIEKGNGKAIIFCPNFVNDNYLRDIILKKKNWIKNKLKKEINVIELSETKKFPILGKSYKIRFLESKKMR